MPKKKNFKNQESEWEKQERLKKVRERVQKQTELKRLYHQQKSNKNRSDNWAPNNRKRLRKIQQNYISRKKNEATGRKGITLL